MVWVIKWKQYVESQSKTCCVKKQRLARVNRYRSNTLVVIVIMLSGIKGRGTGLPYMYRIRLPPLARGALPLQRRSHPVPFAIHHVNLDTPDTPISSSNRRSQQVTTATLRCICDSLTRNLQG